MEYANFTKALEAMGAAVVERARLEIGLTRERENRRTKWAKAGKGWQPISSQVTKAKGRINASGKLAASLKPNIFIMKGTPTLEIKGEDYGIFINEGRKPTQGGGNGSVRRNVEKWAIVKPVRVRDISKPAGGFMKVTPSSRGAQSFLIARKIHHFGFPATRFMADAMNQVIPKYKEELLEALKQDTVKQIKKK